MGNSFSSLLRKRGGRLVSAGKGMMENLKKCGPAPRVSVRATLIGILVLALLCLSGICFVAIKTYGRATSLASEVRAEAEELLKIVELNEINLEREISAWKNVLLHSYEHDEYHDSLSGFYESERETARSLKLLTNRLDGDERLSDLAKRLVEEHKAMGIALRKALRSYNESASDPYRVAHRFAQATAQGTLEELVRTAKAVRDDRVLRIDEDLVSAERRLLVFIIVAFAVFIFLIIWVVDAKVGQPAEKAIRLESELREKQEDLIREKEKAEAANQAKEDFLAVVSHELRTPLNPIIGFSRLLLSSHWDEDTVEMLRSIENSGTHMLKLVEDVLNFTKIEKQIHEFSEEEIDLDALCRSVVKAFETNAKGKRNLLRFESELDQPGFQPLNRNFSISSDPRILKQILFNLLGNACKFTEDGMIALAAGARFGEGEDCQVRIEVRDTGVGIGERDIARVFEPFTQVDSSRSRRHGGVGLGLSLCKSMSEALGGTIGVESQPGEGSVFWLEFPCKSHVAEVREGGFDEVWEGRVRGGDERILVAEDNPENQSLIRSMLKELGFENVRIVDDGEQACRAFDSETYDLMFVDLSMPGRGGSEAARYVRSREKDGEPMTIVALTAYASNNDREECRKAGMNDFLAKPIDIEELSSCLNYWLGRAGDRPHG